MSLSALPAPTDPAAGRPTRPRYRCAPAAGDLRPHSLGPMEVGQAVLRERVHRLNRGASAAATKVTVRPIGHTGDPRARTAEDRP
jgi:hypothetical protein